MLKQLLFSFALIAFSHQYIQACSCIQPSSFCESINNGGDIRASVIIRGEVIESTPSGKEIKVKQMLRGELSETKITIQHGFCTVFFNELEDDSEYIIALNRSQDHFLLVACAISFLKIENEVIKGKIAPGITQLNYKEIFDLESCGEAFSQFAIAQNLQLFPNPTSHAFQVQNISANQAYENLTINIFDTTGRKIGTHIHNRKLLPDEEWLVNIRDFTAGVYVVQISNAFQQVAYKLVKV